VEQELLGKRLLADRQLDVLKVAHHGSATASSELFLRALTPATSVVSVAENNRYGHPASEVMERLETFCGNIYLTKESGAVTIETDGNNYEITPYLEK
jgi:competence protein ComEC